MNNRIKSIDFVRAVAIVIIFLSHYFLYGHIPQMESFGQFLAGTFNVVFFCVSAFLFGMSWNSNGHKPIPILSFLSKRVLRLASSYWPWLLVVFCCFWMLDESFTLKNVIMNFAFLSWFDKMPGVGHFWFVTMIMICYVSFVIITHVRMPSLLSGGGKFLLLMIAVLIQYLMDLRGLPGFMITILLITDIVFIDAPHVYSIVNNSKYSAFVLTITIILSVTTIILLYNDYYVSHRTTSYLLMNASGIMWFLLLMKLGNRTKLNALIVYISTISYEIYLVHHPLNTGPWNVYHLTHHPLIAFVLVTVGTYMIAAPLHKVGNFIYKKLKSNKI